MGSSDNSHENHFLRFACGIILMLICWTHFFSQLQYEGIHVNDMVFGMGRFAIPIFFLISGYFTYSDDGHAERSITKKALHILFLIIFLKLFYLVLDLIYLALGMVTVDYVIHAFLVFEETTAHAWFVYSLLLCYILAYIFWRKNIDMKWMLYIGLVIVAVDLLFTEFLQGMGNADIVYEWPPRRIGENLYPFIGIFFFALGYMIHRNKERVDAALPTKFLWFVMLGSVVIAFFEALFVRGERCNLYISSITLALSLFILTFRLKDDQLRCRPIEYLGREAMPWMYVFFPAAIFFTKRVLLSSWDPESFNFNFFGPFISVGIQIIMSLIMCFLLDTFKKKAGSRDDKKSVSAES